MTTTTTNATTTATSTATNHPPAVDAARSRAARLASLHAEQAVSDRVEALESALARDIAQAVERAVADAVDALPGKLAEAVERQLARVPDLVAVALEQAFGEMVNGGGVNSRTLTPNEGVSSADTLTDEVGNGDPIPATGGITPSDTQTQRETFAVDDIRQEDAVEPIDATPDRIQTPGSTIRLADIEPDLCQEQVSEGTGENRIHGSTVGNADAVVATTHATTAAQLLTSAPPGYIATPEDGVSQTDAIAIDGQATTATASADAIESTTTGDVPASGPSKRQAGRRRKSRT